MAIIRYDVEANLQQAFEDNMFGSHVMEAALADQIADDPLSSLTRESVRLEMEHRLDRGDSYADILAQLQTF